MKNMASTAIAADLLAHVDAKTVLDPIDPAKDVDTRIVTEHSSA